MRIAIVGAGIAGLGSAWLLHKAGHAVTLYESNEYLGGHTHTVDVTQDGVTAPVDTGFLVFNDRTYPKLVALFDELGVASVASEMTFSVRIDAAGLEWAGASVATLFAQPSNALRPDFWRMLADIARFNREATVEAGRDLVWSISLGEFLDERRFGRPFRDWYLLPMAAAIWSSPRRDILDFPLAAFVRFCHNHGLLQITDRPQWRTVKGGGRAYVARIAARLPDIRCHTRVRRIRRGAYGIDLDAAGRTERFDEVVLACHGDEARQLLADPTPAELTLLSAIRYQPNRVVLHTDPALLPRSRRAWAAWNYLADTDADGTRPIAVSYLINKLQPLPFAKPVIVTLNPPFDPDPRLTIREFEYSHPLQDAAAVDAQMEITKLQGANHTWYAGAWLGYGFHEDGLASAHAVAAGIARLPFVATTHRERERVAA
ncbi:MAG: FAD-dependent oxidoreductase [Betaproteobacteria bacterium]